MRTGRPFRGWLSENDRVGATAETAWTRKKKNRVKLSSDAVPGAPDASFLELFYAGFGYDLGDKAGYT